MPFHWLLTYLCYQRLAVFFFSHFFQYDYPYPTNFEAPLDAYPVTQACQLMATIDSPIEALGKAVGQEDNKNNISI